MILAAFLPLLLAQVGPTVSPGAAPPVRGAPLEIPRKKKAQPEPTAAAGQSQAGQCRTMLRSSPAAAESYAEDWLDSVKGSARAEPAECLGMARAALGKWDDAETAFAEARDLTPGNEAANRARRGGMAGNALLAAGKADDALKRLDVAHGEALGAGDLRLAGEIAIDRSRALVLLKRDADAAAALASARTNAADNGQAWLLSATLARRQGKLGEAQEQILTAARLLPLDPEVGLEAGVIAMLAGNEVAARRSWQSVLTAAPGSETARTAQSYLDQLGPDTSPSGR